MHIVLLEPEIPQNAGNIARTCAVTNTVLHLIKPLGFSVEDKYLKRAGLDYWKLLDIRYYENFQDFLDKNPNAKIWMATTKAKHVYTDVSFGENDYLMFGKESAGIPEEILLQYPDTAIRIPMLHSTEHPNAETIYRTLEATNPTMSLATVYKTLDFFKHLRLVQELNVGEGSARYDAQVHCHPHTVCTVCGCVSDLYNEELTDLHKKLSKPLDFEVICEQLILYGKCAACKKAEEEA